MRRSRCCCYSCILTALVTVKPLLLQLQTYTLFNVSASEVWVYSATGGLRGSRVTLLGSGSVKTEYPPSANDPVSFPRRKSGKGKCLLVSPKQCRRQQQSWPRISSGLWQVTLKLLKYPLGKYQIWIQNHKNVLALIRTLTWVFIQRKQQFKRTNKIL